MRHRMTDAKRPVIIPFWNQYQTSFEENGCHDEKAGNHSFILVYWMMGLVEQKGCCAS